jgi:DNA-binding NarL/FixJ family response regulator
VLVADAHAPTREGVRVVLQEDGWEVCAEAGDATEALRLAKQEKPDLCLIDVAIPGGGVQVAGTIARNVPTTRVVMLSVSGDDDDLFDALKAGASGFLLKDMDPSRLGPTLRSVLDGEAALPRSLTARVIDEYVGREHRRDLPALASRGAHLTDSEWNVFDLLRGGATTAQMAERLGVGAVTIRSHIAAILRKLKVSSRQEAVELLADEEA